MEASGKLFSILVSCSRTDWFPSGFKPEKVEVGHGDLSHSSEVAGDICGTWTEEGLNFSVMKRRTHRHRIWKVSGAVMLTRDTRQRQHIIAV